MWISKKKYNELVAQKDRFERIAFEAIQLNARVIDNNGRILEEMEDIQKLNRRLQERNEELVNCCKVLQEGYDFVTKQRDYYFKLLEVANEEEVE